MGVDTAGASEVFTQKGQTDTLSSAESGEVDFQMKKILTWGGVAFLVFFVAMRPTAAANVVKSLAGGLMDVMAGFGDFASNLIA